VLLLTATTSAWASTPPKVRVLVALSGGGLRATAFSHGVLRAMGDLQAPPLICRSKSKKLADNLDTLSGVSGWAFMAAYFSVHPTADLSTKRSEVVKRLAQNVQEVLTKDIAWTTPGLLGGSGFARWWN